jgi:hypothetical protein
MDAGQIEISRRRVVSLRRVIRLISRTHFRITSLLVFSPLLAYPVRSQVCMPGAEIQPDNGYSYIREEVKALQSIRDAQIESQKIQPPLMSAEDPQRLHKTVEFYTLVNKTKDDYSCAEMLLDPYKSSKNDMVHESANNLLLAVQNAQAMNAKLVEMVEAINKATKPEDIDEQEIGKDLANIRGAQHDGMMLIIASVKLSTFGILRVEGTGDDAKPTAFTITHVQRAKLLAEVKELAKKKSSTYVDTCADILLRTLNRQLPMSD